MYSVAAIAAAISIPLAACGGERVDARQLDWNNGIAYKHGTTDPFTGIVEWKTSLPDAIDSYWNNNSEPGVVKPTAEMVLGGCTTAFSNGVLDGQATCVGPNGNELLDVSFKNEVPNGDSKIYDPKSGKLYQEVHWKSGQLDGEQEIFGADGSHLVKHWKGGVVDGEVKAWNAKGAVIADFQESQGRAMSGKFFDRYNYTGNGITDATIDLIQQLRMAKTIPGGPPAYVIETLDNGSPNGPVQIFDGNGTAVLEGVAKNGKLDGQVRYTDEKGQAEVASFDDGRLTGVSTMSEN